MSSAGGCPSRQKMVSVRTSIVPPGPCPPPADTPGASTAATTQQVTASIHDFAVSLGERDRYPAHPEDPLIPLGAGFHVGHGRRKMVEARDGRCRAGLSQCALLRR